MTVFDGQRGGGARRPQTILCATTVIASFFVVTVALSAIIRLLIHNAWPG